VRIYLSSFIGAIVNGLADERVGKVTDVVVRPTEERFPRLAGLVIQGGLETRFFVPQSSVSDLSQRLVRLNTSRLDLRPFLRRAGEVLLAKDILDRQIVNVEGRRVVRVNDLQLEQVDRQWRLVAVDVSFAALTSRLGLGWLTEKLRREVIPWDDIEFFQSDIPVPLHLRHDKIARLHPAEIARLLADLSTPQTHEVLRELDPAKAADTVEELEPEHQAALLQAMDSEEAADILEEMDPDNAADVLGDLAPQAAATLLDSMEQDEADAVKVLLRYPDDTAGGLMTTEFVALPQDLTVEAAIEEMRNRNREDELPDFIPIVYVLQSADQRRLVGVVSLRNLILAEPKTRLSALMATELMAGHVNDEPRDVAETMGVYNLMALPILDEREELVGIVTVDDVLEVLLPEGWKGRLPHVFH
jgi:magnesium transporter